MPVENHKEEVPFSHYVGLFHDLDPQAALKRLPSVAFDGRQFTLTLLGRTYDILWPDYALSPRDGGALPALPLQPFLLRCLLEAKELPDPGQWKTFREMPWGELYIQPFTGRCLTRAAFTFGTRRAACRAACESWEPSLCPMGMQAMSFLFSARLPWPFWCGRGMRNSRPAPSCSIPAILPRALLPRTGWWRAIS